MTYRDSLAGGIKQARIGPVFCRDISMALSQRLEVRQSHALVMTPQLMQAIKLLQLSNLDLAAYVEGELERNPLLERAGEDEGERSPAGPEVSLDAGPADCADRDRDESSPLEQPAVDVDDVLAAAS